MAGRGSFGAWRSPWALLALGACAASPAIGGLSSSPTEVAVRPEDFLGGVECSASPGAMQSFVVTLSAFDDESDTTPFTLPSSQPTPCSAEAGIQGLVSAGKLYIAEIDGYAEPAGALKPFGGVSSGSREMRDGTDKVVVPRWSTRCGLSAASATLAFPDQTNYVASCQPLVDHQSSITALSLSPAHVLAPGGGEAEACQVAKTIDFDVIAGPLAPVIGMACGAPAAVVSATPGASYRLYAHTKTLAGKAVGAECFAVAAPGTTVTPSCDQLSSQGSAIIDLTGLMNKGQPACPLGMFYDVVLANTVLNPLPIACGSSAQIGPLAPGSVTFWVLVHDANGKAVAGGASCTADIAPGRAVVAKCL